MGHFAEGLGAFAAACLTLIALIALVWWLLGKAGF
jgi:hypothetical protein